MLKGFKNDVYLNVDKNDKYKGLEKDEVVINKVFSNSLLNFTYKVFEALDLSSE